MKKLIRLHIEYILRTAWLRYAAAIIVLFGVGAYLWDNLKVKTENEKLVLKTDPIKNDILPGKEKAVLTLADGSIIILDSVANGQLAVQQGSNIIKRDGRIIYDAGQQTATQLTYNTMSTPGVGSIN